MHGEMPGHKKNASVQDEIHNKTDRTESKTERYQPHATPSTSSHRRMFRRIHQGLCELVPALP